MIPSKKHKGVSLVELILSIAILSILSVYIIQMFILSKTLNAEAENLDKSVYLSESIFEMIESDTPLESLSMFKYSKAQTTESGSRVEVFFDKDWNPVDGTSDVGFTMILTVSEIQALAYTKYDYRIVIEKNDGPEMEQIYEIGMQKHR